MELIFKSNILPIILLSNIILSLILMRYFSLIAILFFASLLCLIYYLIIRPRYRENIYYLIILIGLIFILRMIPVLIGYGFVIPGSLLRHLYASETILDYGKIPFYFPEWETQPYNFWPGSYLFLVLNSHILGITIYQLYPILIALVNSFIYIFFFLLVRGFLDWKTALVATLLSASLKPFIVSQAMNSPETLAYLGFFLSAFLLSKILLYKSNNLYFIILLLLSTGLILISHHLTSYFYFMIVVAMVIWSINKKPSLVINYLLIFTVLVLTYWMYISYSFFKDVALNAIRFILSALSNGFQRPEVIVPHTGDTPFSLFWYDKLGQFSSILFYLLGLYALIRSYNNKKIRVFIIWSIILGITFLFSTLTRLGELLESARHIIILAYPMSILISFLYMQIKQRKLNGLFLFIITLIIFIQASSGFPAQIYKLNDIPHPIMQRAEDKMMGQWLNNNTLMSSIIMGDTRVSENVLYYGRRESFFAGRATVDKFFRNINTQNYSSLLYTSYPLTNIALGETKYVKLNYFIMDLFNVKYKVYSKWGLYFPVEKASIAYNWENAINNNTIYNDGFYNIAYIQ
ncbi:hypothetical protein [Neomoorella thermoacetica]|uniref:hypothetical protein n=1 Tax=Neomoorella thermoacetica TaxID=1525 RepID=UPI0030D22A62